MSSQTAASNTPGPPLPAMFARYKDLVEQGLSAAVPSSSDTDLSVLLQYHLGWVDREGNRAAAPTSQGKALRPTLCMFACEALEGDLLPSYVRRRRH